MTEVHMQPHALQLSSRAAKTPPSPIRRLAGLAHHAEQRGTKVFRLNIGQPDVTSPPEFLEGIRQFRGSLVPYETSKGHQPLLEAWCDSINSSYPIGLSPEQMLITMGASEALIFSFMVCCDPGDEILIFDPTYANYIGFAAIAGVRLVPLPCALETDFALPSAEEVERFISPYTKAILLCNPNNPTGTVASDEELHVLLEVCRRNGLYFIVDETYREFVFDGAAPRCIFELSGKDPSVLVVDSLSKRFSLCGARVGCLLTWNEELMKAAFHIAQARLAAPTIEQMAGAYMLKTMRSDYLPTAVREYQSRRDVAVSALSQIAGVETSIPAGGFYLVAKLPLQDAQDFASFMLTDYKEGGVTTFVAPAAGFYMHAHGGRDMIRIAFVLNSEDTRRAIEVLGEGIIAYRQAV